jgi:dTDP-4-amino-4,6-dideoxygalactose transaminase
VGTFGDISVFSFNGNKIITTSGGGALVSANVEYVHKARFLATQALDPAPHYQHSQIGYNYRMSNVCAGIGRGQMEVLPQRILQRRNNFDFYQRAFSGIPEIQCAAEPAATYYSNHWLTVVLIEGDRFTREEIRLALIEDNIDCRPLWKPMHLQPVFEGTPYYGYETCQQLFEKGLCLPSGSNLTTNELNRVVARIYETIAPKLTSANLTANTIFE